MVVVPIKDYALDYEVVYTAPQTKGIYHVQVGGYYKYDGSPKTATATIEVK